MNGLPLTNQYTLPFVALQGIAGNPHKSLRFGLLKGYETACIGRPISADSASPVLARAEQPHADNPIDAACGGQAGAAGDRPHRLLGSPPARLWYPRHGERR